MPYLEDNTPPFKEPKSIWASENEQKMLLEEEKHVAKHWGRDIDNAWLLKNKDNFQDDHDNLG